MKRILVPIDFSSDSINALEHAIVIANKTGAKLRMIHISKGKKQDVPLYFKEFSSKEQYSPDKFFKILIDKYKDKIQVSFDYKLREGKVYKEITNQAKYDDTDLIVMGSHGVNGFESFWIGSNAYKVVSNAECNVMTIRNGFLRIGINNIVMPIDISKETRKKLKPTTELAKLCNATIHVVTVRETDKPKIIARLEKYTQQVCEYLDSKAIKYTTKDLSGRNITDITIDYAKEINAELITIMTEQTENTANIWLGKYAQQMVNNSPIPVLCVHN